MVFRGQKIRTRGCYDPGMGSTDSAEPQAPLKFVLSGRHGSPIRRTLLLGFSAIFALWLLREGRWRDAGWFLIPFAVLGGWIAIEVLQAGLVGLGVVTALGLATWGIVQAVAFRLYANLR